MDNDDKLQLLDIIGISSNNILYSSLNDSLIYSQGSTIIFYNLIKNTKTFLQYYYNTEISIFKFLDIKEQILLIINKSENPLLSIWKLPSFEEIYSQEINLNSRKKFNFNEIYVEKLYSNIFIIIISAIDCCLLYYLEHGNLTNFKIRKIGFIPKISFLIEGFKCFYDDIYFIFISNNTLLYYLIDAQNKNISEKIKLYKKIVFPFKILQNSLIISNLFSLIFFLTSKGNCLIYDKKGENINSINPLNKEEYFISINYDQNLLSLGTNNSKVYIYDIKNNFKLKYFIKEKYLNNIKMIFQLNNDIKLNDFSSIKKYGIEYIFLNQKLDKIFLKNSDNSILLIPFSSLMNDSRGDYKFNSLGNTNSLYSFNHCDSINSIEINNNYNEYETTIYTCSKDQSIIQYNIDFTTNKLTNFFFNLKNILNNNKEEENNNMNINFNNIYDTYLTLIKFHPNDNTKLFTGDNKGFLYIFDISKDYFKYKKYLIDNNSIEFISFSKEGNLICIGILTGKLLIFDINKNFELSIKLCDGYLTQNEIDFRISNNHIITFCYFFKKEKNKDCALFLKDNKKAEIAKLFYEKKEDKMKLNKKKITLIEFENLILDINVHISENYLVILNDKNKILVNEINSGEATAIIDLSRHFDKIYNFQIDPSGLYICLICSNNTKFNKNINKDLILIELGTGEIVNYIKCIGDIIITKFDFYGKYIITGGNKGELCLWKLPYKISNIMINTLTEIEKNEKFWEKYEIKYYNNNDKNIYDKYDLNNNGLSIPKKFKTEISKNNNNIYSEEIENNEPHRDIKTWQYNHIDKNNKNNFSMNINNRNNNIANYMNENYNNNNNNDYFDSNKFNSDFDLKSNKSNNKNSKSYKSYIIDDNNKKNNENINKETNNINNTDKYNSYFPYNQTKKSNRSTNIKNIAPDIVNENIKNEKSLQNCYENFKKERLMKNSFIKPSSNRNIKNTKNIPQKKDKAFSSKKIMTSRKYIDKEPVIKSNFLGKEKYNKKEYNDIDFEIDLDINKIRPNFDPNLYSEQFSQKYGYLCSELIKPFLSYDNNYNNEDENLKYDLSNNTKINKNIQNYINKKQINFSNINDNISENNNKKKKINEAIDILMENSLIKNNNNNKSFSPKDISNDFVVINNKKIDLNKNYNELSKNEKSKIEDIVSNINKNTIEKNTLTQNFESLSSKKRNGLHENINNFEKELNN